MTDRNDGAVGRLVAAWWRALHPDEAGGRGDRAAAARLRRAATPNEVMVLAEAIALYRAIGEATGRDRLRAREVEGVAILAGVLAGVKPAPRPGGSTPPRFAAMLGRTEAGLSPGEHDRPIFSGLRFAALMRAEAAEERLRHLRRAAAVAHGRAFDVARFAADVLRWDEATRRRWIFDYHQQGAAAPAPETTDFEGEIVR